MSRPPLSQDNSVEGGREARTRRRTQEERRPPGGAKDHSARPTEGGERAGTPRDGRARGRGNDSIILIYLFTLEVSCIYLTIRSKSGRHRDRNHVDLKSVREDLVRPGRPRRERHQRRLTYVAALSMSRRRSPDRPWTGAEHRRPCRAMTRTAETAGRPGVDRRLRPGRAG